MKAKTASVCMALAIKPLAGEEYARYFRDMHERCKPLVEAVLKTR